MGWFESIEHSRWLSAQMQALLEHGPAAMTQTGFGHFTEQGHVDRDRPVDLITTARVTYVYSLGVLMGIPGCRKYSDHGVRCLREFFKDAEHGGWFSSIEHHPDEAGNGIPWGEEGARKWQYAHAMLVLASASAAVANRPGAHQLLNEALVNQQERWLDGALVRDGYSRDWSTCSENRTLNSLVHTVEAYLVAAEATAHTEWIDRGVEMLGFIHETAVPFEGRLPENYDQAWRPRPDYNRDDPGVPYAPYGYVIGHGMQLVRLSLQTRAALRSLKRPEPEFLAELADLLFDRARQDGWRRDGQPGFIYTADFEGNPVISDHLEWVVSEAICASVALRRAALDDGASPGEIEAFEHGYRSWTDYLHDYMQIKPGVYVRGLSATNEPTRYSVSLRPDIYHTLQAMLAPRLPLWPPFAAALSRNLLDEPAQPASDKRSWRNKFTP